MKLNRLIAVSIVGFSLLTTSTSAFACDHESGSSWSFFGWCHHDNHDNDHNHDCDHDKDKGGKDCPATAAAPPPEPTSSAYDRSKGIALNSLDTQCSSEPHDDPLRRVILFAPNRLPLNLLSFRPLSVVEGG